MDSFCECGWKEADAGPIGVYCTNPNCPIEARILQGFLSNWLKVQGVSRVADNEKVILVSFNRKPTDNELRSIHEKLR